MSEQVRIDGHVDPVPARPRSPAGRPNTAHVPDDLALIVPTLRLAAILDCTDRWVQQLVKQGMPRHARGRFDLEAVVPWLLEYTERMARPDDGTSDEAQRRYQVARAEVAELRAAQARDEMVPLAEVRAMLADIAVTLRHAAEAAPMKLYTDAADQDRARAIADELCAALATASADMGPRPRRARGAARPAAPA